MTRLFDSDCPPAVLTFAENVECPDCGEIFEGFFIDHTQSLTVEDLTEAPEGRHLCPECDAIFFSTLTGWMFFSEAG